MKPKSARARFNKWIRESGLSLEKLTAGEGLRMMLDFYRDVRAEGCDVEEEGDMLLVEWGRFERGKGPAFHFTITRQFTMEEGDDGGGGDLYHLVLNFRFSLSSNLDSVPDGSRWCEHLEDIEAFDEAIAPAAAALQDYPPLTITLTYEAAG